MTNLPSDMKEAFLTEQIIELNKKYASGLEVLNSYDARLDQLPCMEQLIPIMAQVQKIEATAHLSSADVKEFILQSPTLSELASKQKQLLTELLKRIRVLESDFKNRKGQVAQELDQQSEYNKMKSAYNQNS